MRRLKHGEMDSILDEFKTSYFIAFVEVKGISASHLKKQLTRKIKQRGEMDQIKIQTLGDKVMLSKNAPEPNAPSEVFFQISTIKR